MSSRFMSFFLPLDILIYLSGRGLTEDTEERTFCFLFFHMKFNKFGESCVTNTCFHCWLVSYLQISWGCRSEGRETPTSQYGYKSFVLNTVYY